MPGAIAYALLAVPLAFLVLTRRFFSPSPIVIAMQLAGLLVVVWARLTFGMRSFHVGSNPTQGGLVTTGPYRFVRHPIYAGALLIIGGALVAHHDVYAIVAAACVAAGLAVRMIAEERAVARTYSDYADYAKRTKRIVPWIFCLTLLGCNTTAAPALCGEQTCTADAPVCVSSAPTLHGIDGGAYCAAFPQTCSSNNCDCFPNLDAQSPGCSCSEVNGNIYLRLGSGCAP